MPPRGRGPRPVWRWCAGCCARGGPETASPSQMGPHESVPLFADHRIMCVAADPLRDAEGGTLGILAICLQSPMARGSDEIEIRDECNYLAQLVLERHQKDETFA